jgi:aspartyl-tRNA(Asn)/glutamyl-tRNA(Gln) amidotransferase subunit B
MVYEPTIGIETHAQLQTASKMFCRCAVPPSLGRGAEECRSVPPNSLVCPVCLGMPGSLPVINKRAVEYVLMTGLALHCRLAPFSRFDRKNYNYPDLVKGYQISQFDFPLCRDGWLDIEVDGHNKRIGISDVHLEEDTGKLIHVQGQSWIDFNRSGIPLMEIVTAPDFTSVQEVREYVVELRRILRYLGVNSGNMEEGAMRFEANVSLHPLGTDTKGTRVEVKNLNSFRALLRSMEHEIARQDQVLREGGTIRRETRGWDDENGITQVQRSKELADDYRYFPEPDLPPLEIKAEWVEQIRAGMPELPSQRRLRFATQYELSAYDVGLLTEERDVADYFEQAVSAARSRGVEAKVVANWVTGELFRLLRTGNVEITASRVTPDRLAELIAQVSGNVITMATGKQVLQAMFSTGRAASDIVSEQGLAQIADMGGLAKVIEEVIAANPGPVADGTALSRGPGHETDTGQSGPCADCKSAREETERLSRGRSSDLYQSWAGRLAGHREARMLHTASEVGNLLAELSKRQNIKED